MRQIITPAILLKCLAPAILCLVMICLLISGCDPAIEPEKAENQHPVMKIDHTPGSKAFAVTTSDSVNLPNSSLRLWVGGAGALKITTIDGDTVTMSAVTVGWHELRVQKIFATGTVASNIVAFY